MKEHGRRARVIAELMRDRAGLGFRWPADEAALRKAGLVNGRGDGVKVLGDGELTINADGYPKAKVGANGDLIIDGKAVALTPEQRKLVSAYYGELEGITQAGIAVGKQGAKMAGKAVGAAISGVIRGNTDDIDARMEAEAKKIEAEAKKICNRLNGLRTAQDALAAQVPAFRPYGNLDQKEIDSLLAQRHLVDDAHHCPHGRPTALTLSRAELDRQFGRLG